MDVILQYLKTHRERLDTEIAEAAGVSLSRIEWYRRPPKSLPSNIGMRDDLGNIFKLELHGPRVTGVW